jgi:hypothetical protein
MPNDVSPIHPRTQRRAATPSERFGIETWTYGGESAKDTIGGAAETALF